MNEPTGGENPRERELDERTVNSNARYEIVLTERLQDDIIEPLYEVLSGGFEELNEVSIGKQDMTFDEFKEDALDPSVLKFVAYDTKGEAREAIGCLFVHTDPKKVSWIPQTYYKQQHPELFNGEKLLYTSTLVIGKNSRDLSAGRILIKTAQRFGFDSDLKVMLMDYSEYNSKRLPGLFEYCARKIDENDVELDIEQVQVGKEEYFLIEPQAKPEEVPMYYVTESPLDSHTTAECISLYREEDDIRYAFDERLGEEELEEAIRSKDTIKITIFEGGKLVAFAVLSNNLEDQHLNPDFVREKSEKENFLISIYTTQRDSVIYRALADYLAKKDASLIIKLDENNTSSKINLTSSFGYTHIPEPVDRQHFLAYVPSKSVEKGEK